MSSKIRFYCYGKGDRYFEKPSDSSRKRTADDDDETILLKTTYRCLLGTCMAPSIISGKFFHPNVFLLVLFFLLSMAKVVLEGILTGTSNQSRL